MNSVIVFFNDKVPSSLGVSNHNHSVTFVEEYIAWSILCNRKKTNKYSGIYFGAYLKIELIQSSQTE